MSIAELPTELLLEIATYTIQNDTAHITLSQLAQTCQHFQQVLNPLILTYHDNRLLTSGPLVRWRMKSGEDDKGPGGIHDKMALDGRFQYVTFNINAETKEDDLRSIRCFVFRANLIDLISVDLETHFKFRLMVPFLNACVQKHDLALDVRENFYGSSRHPEEGGPFMFRFHSLGVSNNETSTSRGALSSITRMTTFFRAAIRSLLNLEGRRPEADDHSSSQSNPSYTVVPRQPSFRASLPRFKPQVKSLSITGDILFTASLYPWTLHLLNAAPLTTLSITRVTLTLFNWNIILPLINIPSLLNLSLGKVAIAFPDLLSFLERHSTLNYLNFSEYTMIGVMQLPTSYSKSSFLPNLSYLHATPELILPFLQYRQRGYFPTLHDFALYSFQHNGPPSEQYPQFRNEFYPIYDCISQGQYRNLALTLYSVPSSGLVEWMRTGWEAQNPRTLPGVQRLLFKYVAKHSQQLDDWLRDWIEEDISRRPVASDIEGQSSPELQHAKILECFIRSGCPDLTVFQEGT